MRDLRRLAGLVTTLDMTDPDAISFHEVVCDLARVTKSGPRSAAALGLPLDVLVQLQSINRAIGKIHGLAKETEKGDPP